MVARFYQPHIMVSFSLYKVDANKKALVHKKKILRTKLVFNGIQ